MNRLLSTLLLLGAVGSVFGQKITLFHNTSDDYPWRIPALVCAKNGDLLAMGGHLLCGTDVGWGRCDLYVRTSSDSGRSWSAPFAFVKGTGQPGIRTRGNIIDYSYGYGDAAVAADRRQNRLLVMSCAGGYSYLYSARKGNDVSRALRTVRYDVTYDEVTRQWNFGHPIDITAQIYGLLPTVTGLFVTSGKICQSRRIKTHGCYRLYAALATRQGNFVLYSDDFGKTWNCLGSNSQSCAPKGDEAKCEELPDGSVLLSSRTAGGRIFNIFTYKNRKTGEGEWAQPVYSQQAEGGISVGKNACNGELLLVEARRAADGRRVELLLQSLPTGDDRENVTIFYKELASPADYDTPSHLAAHWIRGLQVSHTTSAYSTMCRQADGSIAFLMEEGWTNDVLQAQNTYNDKTTGDGYDLVFQRLSLNEITGGRYF